MKKLFGFLLVVIAGVLIWFSFAVWVGLYSVYTYPPSKEFPEGATLIISRDEWEPMFNSPAYVSPPKKVDTSQKGGIGFGSTPKPKRPVEIRTIVKLPYVEWAYKKSLEPQSLE